MQTLKQIYMHRFAGRYIFGGTSDWNMYRDRAGGGGSSKSETVGGPSSSLDRKRINDALDKHLEKSSPSISRGLKDESAAAVAAPSTSAGVGYYSSMEERFFLAAAYLGFDESSNSVSHRDDFPCVLSSPISTLPYEAAFILYALYQQVIIGPCKISKPTRGHVDLIRWDSWKKLGNLNKSDAMSFFLVLLEEQDPGWYSRVPSFIPQPFAADDEKNDFKHSQHGAAVIDDMMYIFGGNHDGSYLSDLQALDLKTWIWSKVAVGEGFDGFRTFVTPCSGHSLIAWKRIVLLSVGGHTKDPSEFMQVKAFDLRTSRWSTLSTHGKPPVSRGGHSVTLVESILVIFGGKDAKQSLLNDLHILDLETLTWNEIDTVGWLLLQGLIMLLLRLQNSTFLSLVEFHMLLASMICMSLICKL